MTRAKKKRPEVRHRKELRAWMLHARDVVEADPSWRAIIENLAPGFKGRSFNIQWPPENNSHKPLAQSIRMD